jgi:hypothetical protein
MNLRAVSAEIDGGTLPVWRLPPRSLRHNVPCAVSWQSAVALHCTAAVARRSDVQPTDRRQR